MNEYKFTKVDAYNTLNLINSWINNVDAKTSFALAFTAVLFGFIFIKGTPIMIFDILNSEKVFILYCSKGFLFHNIICNKLTINNFYVFGNKSENHKYFREKIINVFWSYSIF